MKGERGRSRYSLLTVGKIFNEFCTSLKHWKDRFFLIDCRAIPDAMPWRHQDSSVADPALTGVRVEDIRRLCENVIDLHPVHPAMLYAIGLTTIWKHVGHHQVFKDGEGTVATSMSQFLNFPMAGGVRVGKGMALNLTKLFPSTLLLAAKRKAQAAKVVEYENERVLAAKRKAQAAKDIAVGKRATTEGLPSDRRRRKQRPCPLLSELTTGGDGLILEYVTRVEEDTDYHLDNAEDSTEVNSPLFKHSLRSQHSNPFDEDMHNLRNELAHTQASSSTGHGVSSSFGGSHRRAFSGRNLGGDGIGSSLRGDVGLPMPFVPTWNLTTHSILNDAELTETHNQLVETVQSRNKLSDDYKALQQAACSEEEVKAFLATTADYDPACQTTFMSEFESLFNKSYPYVEKLVESFQLPLGDLQNMWPEDTGHNMNGNDADVQ
nr:hypothetical protein [Tanacetum cinerariifolium]